MADINPYAPPATDTSHPLHTGRWSVEGDKIKILRGGVLPAIDLTTGEERADLVPLVPRPAINPWLQAFIMLNPAVQFFRSPPEFQRWIAILMLVVIIIADVVTRLHKKKLSSRYLIHVSPEMKRKADKMERLEGYIRYAIALAALPAIFGSGMWAALSGVLVFGLLALALVPITLPVLPLKVRSAFGLNVRPAIIIHKAAPAALLKLKQLEWLRDGSPPEFQPEAPPSRVPSPPVEY